LDPIDSETASGGKIASEREEKDMKGNAKLVQTLMLTTNVPPAAF